MHELGTLLDTYNADGTVSDATTASLRDRLAKARGRLERGQKSAAAAFLDQLVARARNQVKGDERDVMVRGLLVETAQRAISELRE
jgi:hypothetical protein